MNIYGTDAAFPFEHPASGPQNGLTKREYFAASMMAALVQAGNYSESPDGLAHGALLRADALIAALNEVKS